MASLCCRKESSGGGDGKATRQAGRGSPMTVRVLIVDDSGTMRRLLRLSLSREPGIEVVGEAADAAQAAQRIRDLRPDVLTLDVEMPGTSGLEFLAQLMAQRPMPVVMVSSETRAGSTAAVEALSLGAVDCIGKPAGPSGADDFARLPSVVLAAATANLRPAGRVAPAPRPAPTPPASLPPLRRSVGDHTTARVPQPTGPRPYVWNGKIVLIGASTGGVEALERVLEVFPANGPPTLITQHMPESFLASFAQRLDNRIAPGVALARDGEVLEQGRVYLAPGGDSHLRLAPGLHLACQLHRGPKRSSHRPSVDELFESAQGVAAGIVAVMLTGMGRDGAEGMLGLKRAGSYCIAQDQASSVVWGMPRVAAELGAVDEVLPLSRIGEAVLEQTSRGRSRQRRLG